MKRILWLFGTLLLGAVAFAQATGDDSEPDGLENSAPDV